MIRCRKGNVRQERDTDEHSLATLTAYGGERESEAAMPYPHFGSFNSSIPSLVLPKPTLLKRQPPHKRSGLSLKFPIIHDLFPTNHFLLFLLQNTHEEPKVTQIKQANATR